MVWYTGQFYALFFLTQTLKVDAATANLLIAASLILGTPFFIVFGWLSDSIGRKPIIMAGCLLAALTYFPLFKALTKAANPALAAGAGRRAGRRHGRPGRVLVPVQPGRHGVEFTSPCDIAKQRAGAGRSSYENADAAGRHAGHRQGRRQR